MKAPADGSMRLKGYSVNGSLLRMGSTNESHLAGRPDNDLIVIMEKGAVAALNRKFEAM
jgi:hypothetical protein